MNVKVIGSLVTVDNQRILHSYNIFITRTCPHTPTSGNSGPRHWDDPQDTGTVSGMRLHYYTADFGGFPMDRAAFGSGDKYLRVQVLYVTTSFRG